jgi:hypothetical protein
MLDFLKAQGVSFYIYGILVFVWLLHLLLSIRRMLKLYKSTDMRLNVRFREKGVRSTVKWGLLIQQAITTVIILTLTILALTMKGRL